MNKEIVAALSTCTALLLFSPAAGQGWEALERKHPPDPAAQATQGALASHPDTVRVLVAGDSWAQYMWDDGAHNQLLARFGLADKRAFARSLGSDPGPGYTGPEYAVSGSEARQWANPNDYPWIANLVAELQANPHADVVLLSIGGNDVLAGKSDGGWYKDMDLDAPGAEQLLFDAIEADTRAIIDAAQAVRPGVQVQLMSYDYPNFNTGFWCFAYACPKRQDLSRDPSGDLITDAELNDMMVRVETQRIGWANADPRLQFDHAVGLMHRWYGDGVDGPLVLPAPGTDPPGYLPFPGGNEQRPSLRGNFRSAPDPIHLDAEGYRYKVGGQMLGWLFAHLRHPADATLFALGNGRDGWTDGMSTGSGLRLGSTATGEYAAILGFDSSTLPDQAQLTGASLYLLREGGAGSSPFATGGLGTLELSVAAGSFGAPGVEASDLDAPADATVVADAVGAVSSQVDALRIDLGPTALAAFELAGTTELRLRFAGAAASAAGSWVQFAPGGSAAPPATAGVLPSLADFMGEASAFLDLRYEMPVAATGAARTLVSASPNPFRHSTQLRWSQARAGRARIILHDLRGRAVASLVDGWREAGSHAIAWDGRDGGGRAVAAGTYFLRLDGPSGRATARVLRLGR